MKHLTFKDVRKVAQGRWGQMLSSLVESIMIDAIATGQKSIDWLHVPNQTKPINETAIRRAA